MTARFLAGRALARTMYEDAVQPLMRVHALGLPYGAALVGPGSDVLGYDTERSMDHDWGPRLTLFLSEQDLAAWSGRLDEMFLRELPPTVAGFPTRFREFADDPGVVQMATRDEDAALSHRVRITAVSAFMQDTLGIGTLDELDVATWLTVPEQTLLEVTGGEVFRDDPGELREMRERLRWYPDDIWRYKLAAVWKRIAQVEPFVGRTGEVDDDLGSQVIAMSLVRDAMRIALLQERQYAPYAKWLGSAFARLPVAARVMPHLDAARYARDWQAREKGVVEVMTILAERQNDLGLAPWVDVTPRPFHSRPFTIIDAERIAEALTDAIEDPEVRALPRHLGGIDQFVDSTDALVRHELRDALRAWLRGR